VRQALFLALAAALFFSAGEFLHAGDDMASPANSSSTSWWKGPYLTGDWGGTRTRLVNDGIDPYLIYTSIVAANVSGGVRQGGPEYAQDVNPGVTFDLQKLMNWDGATINLNGVDRIGHTIKPDVGSVYDPVQIYGGQTYTLYNVTLEQRFLDDVGAFKIGRLSPGDDFAESPLYNYYVNNGIDGQIRAVIDDTRFKTYPFPVWGARLRFDPSPQFNIQTGIFEASDHLTDRALHGVDFGLEARDGVMLVQQFGWTPTFAQEASATGKPLSQSGLPGHYFLGGYWSNSNYPQFGTNVLTRISYGFYAHGDQMVYRPEPGSDVGLTVFGTAACDPQPNTAIIPFQLSGGALYQGLVPDRSNDMTILGAIYGNFSDDYGATIEPVFGTRPGSEIDLELGYRVQFNAFAYAQPDLQYVVEPGGTGKIPNAFILAAQFGLTF
jgi:porin